MGTSRTSPSRRRRSTIVVGTLVVLTAAAGCTSSKSSGGDSGSSVGEALTFGTIAAPPSLNPAVGDPAYGATYQWAYDPLVVMQPDGTFGPGLAVKFGYVAGSNNKVYEMTLRNGVKFSDGETLDAKAVKTYLDYLRAQKTGSLAPLLANVSTIDATGAHDRSYHAQEQRPEPDVQLRPGVRGRQHRQPQSGGRTPARWTRARTAPARTCSTRPRPSAATTTRSCRTRTTGTRTGSTGRR